MTIVTQPVPRVDGPAKVTGSAEYAVDHKVPGSTYAWPVQSTVAVGRVRDIDTAGALAVSGVLDVLTHENVPAMVADGEVSPAHQGAVPDLLVMQSREIRYRGQLVAAVVAESLEAARQGADAVRVTYDAGQASLTLRPDDPSAFVPELTNDLSPGEVVRGDADADFAAASVQLDRTYQTSAQFAVPMEPHAAIALWDGDRLTAYCSDQGPAWTAITFAALLGLPAENVEVVTEYVGGGFGSKAVPTPPLMLAVLAARHVGRPVKVALDRRQASTLTNYRSPSIQRIRLGATHDGQISSIIHESTGQTSRLIPYADQTVTQSRLVYAAPHCRTTTRTVPLDVGTPGWVRAPGEAPGMFALESAMDELAELVDLDPIDLRILNEPATDPESGKPFSSRNLVSCLRTGADLFGWSSRSAKPSVRSDERWLYGMGVASAAYPVLIFPSTATASIDAAGRYSVEIGAVDIGTGSRTALHQIAADALGVPMSEVDLHMGRSSWGLAPFAGGSMGTASWGWAIDGACKELRRRLSSEDHSREGLRVTWDSTTDLTEPDHARQSYGAHFAAVRVDRYTGECRVDRLLGVFAAGRIINPATARSQAVGSMIMGLGMALTEHAAIDEDVGGWATQDLAGYHVPAHADVRDVEAVFLDEDDGHIGPIGGKGIGEIGIVGVTAAIVNALYNATGTRVRSLPARPRSLMAATRALPGSPEPQVLDEAR